MYTHRAFIHTSMKDKEQKGEERDVFFFFVCPHMGASKPFASLASLPHLFIPPIFLSFPLLSSLLILSSLPFFSCSLLFAPPLLFLVFLPLSSLLSSPLVSSPLLHSSLFLFTSPSFPSPVEASQSRCLVRWVLQWRRGEERGHVFCVSPLGHKELTWASSSSRDLQ